MSRTVNAALMPSGAVVARVSPTKYRWANQDGSFSNSRPGDRSCYHMPEAEARQLIERDGEQFRVKATGKVFSRRIPALGAAVIAAKGAW